MANTDLRVQRTKKLLKDNFKSMFLNGDFEHITVKELCEKSMINRRTFYLHYNSMDDIITEVLEELSLEFLEYTNDYDHFANPERIIKDYFEFTNANPLYEKLNNNSDLDFIREQLNKKVVGNVTNHFNSIKHLDDFEYNMARIYLNSTAVAMYRYWSIYNKSVPMEKAIKITAKLVKNGIKSVSENNV